MINGGVAVLRTFLFFGGLIICLGEQIGKKYKIKRKANSTKVRGQ